jgi:hypothetical protein
MQAICSIPPTFMLGPFRTSDIAIIGTAIILAGLFGLIVIYIAASNRRRSYRNGRFGRN